jgi:ubiquinone/menaquinone biosynthesis C-methylase UbiE
MAAVIKDPQCCPSCRGGLISLPETVQVDPKTMRFRCEACGKIYTLADAHIDFLDDWGLIFKNRREKFFREIYARSYTPLTNIMFIPCGGARNARNEVMSRLKIRDGDSVLETGIGYGENLLWLASRYRNLRFYGLDIQKEMLAHCISNLKRWKIAAELSRADAQELPYRDSSFDVVFHLGAINLFEDKGKAIREMIRVARPGTRIVIADETEKAGRLFSIFTGKAEKIVPPVDDVPPAMKNISLSTIWRGYGYVIEFDVVK